MDIRELAKGAYIHENPEYNPKTKKGKFQPQYIRNADPNGAINQGSASAEILSQSSVQPRNLDYLGDPEKYGRYDVTVSPVDANLNDELAKSQSNWSKLFNSLSQTVISEVGIGTVKAFSDIIDAAINGVGSAFFNTKNDYTNPVSKVLEEWKENFDNSVAPIYVEDGLDISNGGLGNFGWWMSNLPSIASSLTLLIPGESIAAGATKLLGTATKGRATAKAMRSLRKLTGVESLTSAQNIEKVKQAEKLVGTALVMRTAENYQEARGTYKDIQEETINHLNSMNPEEYNNWINTHKDYLKENNLNPNDKESIADRIASDAANVTFREDFANTVFDIVQLWGLRDASKIFRNVKSTKVMADHRASIEALGKNSEELAEAAAKSSKFSALAGTASDIIRGTGKAAIAESTEGIEEAINYIAQQEGLTVGKSILYDLSPTSFGSRLNSYMSDPLLWESAFWGLAGGIVFQGLGSAYNQAKVKHANAKAAKERKENEKTGESVETNKWFELEELPEIKSARAAVNRRLSRVNDAINKISDINKGINIFGKRDEVTKELPNFEGSDDSIALQKERARTSVIDEFVADITTDAIHSGTYDLLREYLASPEMTKAMADRLKLNQEEATRFTRDILAKSERVKNEYNKQVNHISAQIADINADRKTKDAVPLPYIQILAKQNLDKVLTGENLNDQGNVIQDQINTLRSNPAFDGILDSNINYEDIMTIGSITSSYVNYEAQKKAIKADDKLSDLSKLIKVDEINKKQTILLRELERMNTINGKKSSPLGRILFTLKSAEGLKYDETGKLVEDKDVIEKTDKEILKEHGYTVTDTEVEDAAKSFSEYTDTLSAFDNLIAISKKEIDENNKAAKELKEISTQLYERYKLIADIRIAKLLNSADIATTKTQIAEKIDIIHNQNNENRLNMIKKAEEKLLDLYTRYDRSVIDNLIAKSLDGHQDEAKILAKQQLTKKNDDAVMFEDVFDILNITSASNVTLAKWVKRLIDGKEWIEHIQRMQNEVGEKSTTSEETISEDENKELNNQSDEDEEKPTVDENALNKDKNDEEEQQQEEKPIIPDGATPVTDDYKIGDVNVASMSWNNGNAIFYNKKGIKVGNSSMSEEEFKKHTAISSTGGEESNPTLNNLKEALNNNFDYLKIQGANDIRADKNFDVDAALENVRQQAIDKINGFTEVDGYVVTDEAKEELLAIVNDRVEELKKRLNRFKELLNKKNPTVDEAATELAMASKIGIINDETALPNLFVVGFENFIDAYAKISITPIKDGKKVISIQEILNIVNSVVGDQNTAGYVLEKLKTYLKSHEVASKYVILDADTLNKDYNAQNSEKDKEDIQKQSEQFRVNILDYVDFYSSDEADSTFRKEFFDVLNRLRQGDVLDLVVDGDVLFIKSGNTVIGSITKAIYENNKFTKINKGWVEDVAINAGGDIVSDTMDVYKQILTSDEPIFNELRGIIIEAIAAGEINNKIIKEFIESDFIQAAINANADTLIVKGGEDIEKNAKDMIEHLVRIYNYSTQNVNFKTKEDKIDAIHYAIENYFASIFSDYDTINRINKDTKVKIEYINDGQVNTKFESGTNHHEDLPFISSNILKSKAKLGFFDPSDAAGTNISGEQKGPIVNSSKLTKLLAIYDRNGAISYVTVKELNSEDYNKSAGYQRIFALAKKQLKTLLNEAVTSNTEEAYNALADAINNIIYNTNNTEENIPLFVGLTGKRANFKFDRSKGQINIYFNYNKNAGEKPVAFSIFRNSRGFRFEADSNGKKIKIEGSKDSFVEDTITMLMDIIKNNSTVNIDTNGIRSDNNPSKNISSGFVHRKNGKIEVFGETYDSYNDFIINNGLARVNLNEPQDNSNFVARGREQRLNQVMYISTDVASTRPVEEIVDETKYPVNKPEIKTLNDDIFVNVSKAFENNSTSGKDLFIAAYGEEAYNDMLNIAGEFDIMEAILPLSVVYNPNLNIGPESSLEAKTNPTNHTIRINVGSKTAAAGRTRVELAPGQVMVGDKFIKLLASNNGYLRNRAIAVMIHERLHWLIENNPNHTRKEILDAITPIYDKFFELCQNVVDNYNESTAAPEEKTRYLRAKKAINDFKKYSNTRTYPDPLTKFDEFLVESITNIDYNALLNDFKAFEKVEKGEDNIFTKLLKFVMKYLFNREVKTDSLLEQEFNTLSNLLNNKEITIPAEQKTVVTTPATGRRAFKKITVNINRETESTDFRDRLKRRDERESSAGIIESYNVESITGFVSSLPMEQQLKFNSLVNNGQLEYKCYIK